MNFYAWEEGRKGMIGDDILHLDSTKGTQG